MKTHNAVIYHCQRCGNVAHREPELEAPWCCGGEMTNAARETICEAECVCGEREQPATRPRTRTTAEPVLGVPPKG